MYLNLNLLNLFTIDNCRFIKNMDIVDYNLLNSLNIKLFTSDILDFNQVFSKNNIEYDTEKRYLNYENPTIKFKVKIGNYLPKKPYEENFDNIFTTFDFKTLTDKKSL